MCVCVCVCVCADVKSLFPVCVCGCSGGRNITVTGAGFDLIQSATMLVMPSKDEASNQSGSVRVSPSTNYHTNQLTNYTHTHTHTHTHIYIYIFMAVMHNCCVSVQINHNQQFA